MTAMALQTLLALLVVAVAVAYVARRFWRTVRGGRASGEGDGCGAGGCGCETAPVRPAVGRRGERR